MRRHSILTELLEFSVIENDIYYIRKISSLPQKKKPEQHAREIAERPFWIIKTTGWRYQDDSTGVILTWAALLEHPDSNGMKLLEDPQTVSNAALSPDTDIEAGHDLAAWNAIRHFSFMLNYDASFARKAAMRGIAQSIRLAGHKFVTYQNSHSS